MLAFCKNPPIILIIILFLTERVTFFCYAKGAFELEMLPAQIPLTLEHLFPTPSNSNAGTAPAVLFICQERARGVRAAPEAKAMLHTPACLLLLLHLADGADDCAVGQVRAKTPCEENPGRAHKVDG